MFSPVREPWKLFSLPWQDCRSRWISGVHFQISRCVVRSHHFLELRLLTISKSQRLFLSWCHVGTGLAWFSDFPYVALQGAGPSEGAPLLGMIALLFSARLWRIASRHFSCAMGVEQFLLDTDWVLRHVPAMLERTFPHLFEVLAMVVLQMTGGLALPPRLAPFRRRALRMLDTVDGLGVDEETLQEVGTPLGVVPVVPCYHCRMGNHACLISTALSSCFRCGISGDPCWYACVSRSASACTLD